MQFWQPLTVDYHLLRIWHFLISKLYNPILTQKLPVLYDLFFRKEVSGKIRGKNMMK